MVKNLFNLVENEGFKIIEIDVKLKKSDGIFYGMSLNGNNCVCINKNRPIESKRFSVLHELCHLLFGFDESNIGEECCNIFASNILFSEKDLQREFYDYTVKKDNFQILNSIDLLEKIQAIYGISIKTMCYRLYLNDIISEEQYDKFKR